MATKDTIKKKVVKKARKQVKKAIKKNRGLGIALLILVILLGVAFGACWHLGYIDALLKMGDNQNSSSSSEPVNQPIEFDGTIYEEFQIHFLQLGNWYTGDSVYIKAGDNDILIDAGSKYDSADDIINYVDQFCTDKKLEYVIATHAHEDHIAALSGGTKDKKAGILYYYDIGTIIEFAKTDSTSKVYSNYCDARNYAVSKGAKCYTALEMWKDPSLRTISLGEGMSMTTLYQKFYEEKADTENDYSVCTLFTYNEQNYLFTGDLESEGEQSLVDSNTLPEVTLFKAGHHGSRTSSNICLLEVIKPKVVCVCCCCGSDQYTSNNSTTFPTQEFVNRVSRYTSNVYVTTISTDNANKKYEAMNGYIVFSSNGSAYSVVGSNNSTVLKDTEWFKNNRTCPTNWISN